MKMRSIAILFLILVLSNRVFGQTQPIVTSFSPLSGPAGTEVTITGDRFSTVAADNIVYFGEAKATVKAASAKSLTVIVPPVASNKPISVTVNKLVAQTNQPFRITYQTTKGVFNNSAFAVTPSPDPNDTYLSSQAIGAGDFDNDGKADLVTANETLRTLSFYKNTGNNDQPFTTTASLKISLSLSVSIVDLAVADINNDGKLDVMVLTSDQIKIYLNQSNGSTLSFTNALNLTAGSFNLSLAIGDLDGDGKLDIVAGAQSKIYIFNNTSTAAKFSFATTAQAIAITTGSQYARSIGIADIDGDSKSDLAIACDDFFSVLRNTSTSGAISFAPKTDFTGKTDYLAIDDIDADGKKDIITSTRGSIFVYTNKSTTGLISLTNQQEIKPDIQQAIIRTGDLNGDGKPEIILGLLEKKVLVLENRSTAGNPVFATAAPYYLNTFANGLVLADWNSDGKLDIAVNHAENTASILMNQIDAPAITSYKINAETGVVTLQGTQFTGLSSLKFGTTDALSYTVVSDTEITARVPANTQGNIVAKSTGGTGYLAGFSNTLAPVVSSFSPLAAPAGASITITGKNFSPTIGENMVYFGSVAAVITAASPNSLTVTVPTGAKYAPLTVYTNSLSAMSVNYFNVTFGDGSAQFPLANSFANSNTTLLTGNTYDRTTTLVAADFNADGKTDLFVENLKDLLLYQNTGDPIAPFKTRPSFKLTTPHYYYSLGDLNGDGKPDLVISNEDNTFDILKNTSSQSSFSFERSVIQGIYFTSGRSPSLSGRPSICTDLDNDGRLDVVTLGIDFIDFFRNISTGNSLLFTKAPLIMPCPVSRSGNDTKSMTFSDVNGDGKQDLIVLYEKAVNEYAFAFYLNTSENGSISFSRKDDLVISKSFYSFDLVDMNNDGLPEIVLTTPGPTSTLSIIQNSSQNSTISFSKTTDIKVGNTQEQFAFGDLDGDGKPDMAMRSTNNKLAILKNTSSSGGISFSEKTEYAIGNYPSIVALADINNDGKLDIAVADGNFNEKVETFVSVLFNKVKQPILGSFLIKTPGASNVVTLNGANLDGTYSLTVGGVSLTDFTVVSATEISVLIPNQLSGTITVKTSYGSADLNGYQGRPTPVIQSFSPSLGKIGTAVSISGLNFSTTPSENIVYFGSIKAEVKAATSTSLSVIVPAGASYQPISVNTAGLIAYANLPFVTTYDNGGSVFLKRNAFAPKEDVKLVPEPLYYSDLLNLASADLDGDGKPELITTETIFKNTGDPLHPFSKDAIVKVPFLGKPCFADFDGDGKIDVATSAGTSIKVYRNTSTVGNFSFETGILFPAGQGIYDITVGDVDGDGKVDLISANYDSNTVSVLRNIGASGEIKFAAQQDYATGKGPAGVCVADFDNDGKLDIAAVNSLDYSISVLKNTSLNGIIGFAPKQNYIANEARSIALGDFDGDGKPDLAVYSYTSGLSASLGNVFKNTSTAGNIAFAAKYDYPSNNIPYAYNGKVADMDGDGKPDLVYTQKAKSFFYIHKNNSTASNLAFDYPTSWQSDEKDSFWESTVGDWNLDGKPDIAIRSMGIVSIFLNQASSTTPELSAMNPGKGGEDAVITLTGKFLENTTSVKFAGIEAKKFTVVSPTSLQVTVPSSPLSYYQPIDITLVTPNGAVVLNGFNYINKPTISNYTITGPSPDYTIVVTGANLADASAVSIDGVASVSFVVNSTNKITAISKTPVTSNIAVTTPGGIVNFSALPLPAITSFSPASGKTGDKINIVGTSLSSTTAIKFGTTAASSFQVMNDNLIVAVVGTGASGEITIQNATGSISKAGFTYLVPPTLTSFAPTSGTTGTKVILTGTSFTDIKAVKIGGTVAASFNVLSPTTLEIIIGEGASGSIELTTAAGSAIIAGFTFLPKPSITSVNSLNAGLGSEITLTGQNLSAIVSVSFGGTPATSFKILSATSISAVIGNGSSGDILIKDANGLTATYSGFTFVPKPKITASGSTVLINGASVLLSANTGNTFNYVWKKDGETIVGNTKETLETKEKGSYTVSILSGSYTTTSDPISVEAYFIPPADNFKIKSTGESCIKSNDGSFTISTLTTQNYTALLTGNNLNKTYSFTNFLEVKDLATGTYSICITVKDHPDYKQCFTINITAPKNLSVFANVSDDKLKIQLEGGNNYTIELNGAITKTTQSSIELQLSNGSNELKITADKLCQGVFEKTYLFSSAPAVYPNPFENNLTLRFPPSLQGNEKIDVRIYDTQGKSVFANSYPSTSNTVQLELGNLRPGVYILKFLANKVETIQKIVKK